MGFLVLTQLLYALLKLNIIVASWGRVRPAVSVGLSRGELVKVQVHFIHVGVDKVRVGVVVKLYFV